MEEDPPESNLDFRGDLTSFANRILTRWFGLDTPLPTRSNRLWSLGVPTVAFSSVGLLILHVGRNQWFFGDEWAFLLGRQAGSMSDLFRPHNEHWSTLPILIYRALYNLFGIASYRPFLAVLVFLNVLLALTVFRTLRRAGAPLLVSTALGVVLMSFGAGADNILWAFQIGFVGSLLCSLQAFHYIEAKPNPSGEMIASIWLLAALGCSALGVSALVGASLTVAFSRSRGSAVRILAMPWLALILWLSAQWSRVNAAHERDTVEALLQVPRYVLTSLSATVGELSGMGIAFGAPVLIAIGSLLFVRFRSHHSPAGAMAGLLTLVVAYALIGFSRVSLFGLEQAGSSRYMHVGAVLLVPALGSLLYTSAMLRSRQALLWTSGLLCLVAAGSILGGLYTLRSQAWAMAEVRGDARERILAVLTIVANGGEIDLVEESQPVPHNPDIFVFGARALLQSGIPIPDLPSYDLNNPQIATTLAAMQMALVRAKPSEALLRFERVDSFDTNELSSNNGCLSTQSGTSDPSIVLATTGRGYLEVTSREEGTLEIFRAAETPSFVQEASIRVALEANQETYLLFADDYVDRYFLRLDPPPGSTFIVCGEV